MAAQEVLTLNGSTPQIEVPQTGSTYEMPRDVNITGDLTVTGTFPAPEGTAVLSTGEAGASSFLREDGDGTSSWQPIPAPEGTAILSTGEAGGTKFLGEDGDGTSSWKAVTVSGAWNVSDDTNGNYGHGATALDSLTAGSGISNVAIGKNAGTDITTGDGNICLGLNAGVGITIASQNICIGQDAGNGTGYTSRVLIGQDTDGGHNCVAIGASALKFSSGNNNVAIGQFANGSVSTSGTDNVFVGSNVATTCTGSKNVVLGAEAGTNIGAFDYNVLIGYNVNGASAQDQLIVGNGTQFAIDGFFGARTDTDYSGKTLTITGPSAYASASTNQNGGNLVLRGGQKATGGGISGKVQISNVLNVAAVYTVATLPTGAVGDVARVTDANAPAIGSTVASGGAAAALCWFNGSNWTVIGI